VIVPTCYQGDEIPIPVDSAAQRNSLLIYIAADGTYLRPLLILPRKTIESELIEQGTNSELATMVHQEHGFILTVLFEDWCYEVFSLREKSGASVWSIREKQSSFQTGSAVTTPIKFRSSASSADVESNCFHLIQATKHKSHRSPLFVSQ
jgi:hypothetical protein